MYLYLIQWTHFGDLRHKLYMAFISSERKTIVKHQPVKGSKGIKGYIEKSYQIFIDDDIPELDSLNRDLVLDIKDNVETISLHRENIYPLIRFSEYVPVEWNDKSYELHILS